VVQEEVELEKDLKKKKEESDYLVPTREVENKTEDRMGNFLGRDRKKKKGSTAGAKNDDHTYSGAARQFIKAKFFTKDKGKEVRTGGGKGKGGRAGRRGRRRGRGGGGDNDDDDSDEDDDDDDFDDDDDDEGGELDEENKELEKEEKAAIKTMDMCCGWAMVPIAETLRSNQRKMRVDMSGGTPFAVVQIKEEDVAVRPGTVRAIGRMFGFFKVISTLDILITPSVPAAKFIPRPVPTAAQGPKGAGASGQAVQAPQNPDDVAWFTKLLPPNIVLPTSSVTVVGMYRRLLMKSMQLNQNAPDRVLPQTGVLHHADALLSSFPRLLSDEAACRVLLLMWKREFPKDLDGKAYKDMTVNDTSNIRALQVFRGVVLRLWRAYSSPHSMPDKLNPVETPDQVSKREMRIRELVNIPTDGKAAAAEAAKNTMTAKAAAAAKNVQQGKPITTTKNAQNSSGAADGGSSAPVPGIKTGKKGAKAAAPEVTIVGGVVVTDPNAHAGKTVHDEVAMRPEENKEQVEQPLCTPFHSRELLWTGRFN